MMCTSGESMLQQHEAPLQYVLFYMCYAWMQHASHCTSFLLSSCKTASSSAAVLTSMQVCGAPEADAGLEG
jgi:hypothetical protein